MQSGIWIKIGLVLFLFLSYYQLSAQHRPIVIDDMGDQWLVYDKAEGIYAPLVGRPGSDVVAISFQVDLDKYAPYQLYLRLPAETSILIEQRMVDYLESEGAAVYSIDSLRKIYGSTLFLTLYNPGLSESVQPQTFVMADQGDSSGFVAQQAAGMHFDRRADSPFHDYFVFAVLIILIIYTALLNIHPKSLRGFYDFSRTLSINVREENIFKGKIFDNANTPILIAQSFLIGFLGLTLFSHISPWLALDSFGGMLGYWVLISFGIFIFFMLKYVLVAIIGKLFDTSVANRHYLEYVRMSKIFFAILFIILIFCYLGLEIDIASVRPFIVNFIIGFLILRVVLIYLKFIQSSTFKNLYLFSYLCSTEIAPLAIGIRILV